MFRRKPRPAAPPTEPPLDAEELDMLRTLTGHWRSLWNEGRPSEDELRSNELIIASGVARMVGVGYRTEPATLVPDGELDAEAVAELRRLAQQRHNANIDLDLTERERDAEMADLAGLITHAASRMLHGE